MKEDPFECASCPWGGADSVAPVNVGCSDGWSQRPDKQQAESCTRVCTAEAVCVEWGTVCASAHVRKAWEPNPSPAAAEKDWAWAAA